MKKLILLIGLALLLAGCGIQGNQRNLTLQNLGPAPGLENEVWINSDEPLRLVDLQGKVVLLEMWTFG
ncbi:MAG: lipoprotein [Anaerolineales bacterium]|nr:lipoprotein [Anaerolineales bacterium]